MGDPHTQAILNVAADDFGKWAKGRYRVIDRKKPPCSEDPLAVFRAAIRRAAFEEAARLVEGFARDEEQRVAILAEFQRLRVAAALRAAQRSVRQP